MNAAIIAVICLLLLFAGYRFYSRFLAGRIFMSDSDEPMPSAGMRDDVDYVPARKGLLFGHHFSSIAGAAPILGPAIAVIWGWLPALLWIVLGAIFMGAVQDFGALVISARHKGDSIGSITEQIIGPRAKRLFLLIIFLLVFIVIAVFAYVIATLFVNYPGTVIPINFEIIVAILIGYRAKKGSGRLLLPSVFALILLYVLTYVGFLYPVHLPEWMWINGSEVMTWIVFLMAYGFIAATLPVWVLLQPRDYINSHQLIVGLVLIYAGMIVASPEMDAPAIHFAGNPVSWFPFLFITIACGAISGFHALVASGTTSKQLTSMRHARFIGYGSMIGEASLAVAATIAVAAGFDSSEAWLHHYSSFETAGGMGNQLTAFVQGTTSFLAAAGLDIVVQTEEGRRSLAAVFVSVLVISFAATSLDTAVRIQRYIVQEIGRSAGGGKLTENRYWQAFIAVGLSFLLVLWEPDGTGGLKLWPLFGSTNQLLGSLTLLVISIWLFRLGKNFWVTLLPMLFITAITSIATYFNFLTYLEEKNWLLVLISLVIGICQLWITLEGLLLLTGRKKNNKIRKE